MNTRLTTFLLGLCCSASLAAQGFIPADLAPGEAFRVLAVTDATRDATSIDIADYDAFVIADIANSPALSAMNTNWRALASTTTIAARDHTQTVSGGVPIYLPNGQRVFDNYDHMWSAYLNPPLTAPNITITGQAAAASCWTGSDFNGTSTESGGGLGNSQAVCVSGFPGVTNFQWMFGPYMLKTSLLSLYAISDVVTVPVLAVESVRIGTPPNPNVLLPGQTSKPIIGQTWDPLIDHSAFVPNALLDVAMFGSVPVDVSLPFLGTVLCDQLFGSLTALPNQPFAWAIPNNVELLGRTACVQGLTLDTNGFLHATNAIDITVGSY